jgi:small neutral amino acid transporter SnatA (MarC family)
MRDRAAHGRTASPAHAVKLSVIERTGLATAVLVIVLTMTFAMPGWRTMFRDFGSLDNLPLLTRIVLVPWSIPFIASPAVASLAMALWFRHRPTQRHRWILAAVILAFIALAICVVGTRLPIFIN